MLHGQVVCIPHWYEAFRTGINEVAKDTFFKILFNDPELQIKLKLSAQMCCVFSFPQCSR
jgi:hypothetical protein